MCDYCKNMKNSDNEEPVILGRLCVGEILGNEMTMLMEMDCYEHEETGDYEIHATLECNSFVFDAVVGFLINYCPIYGRKLVDKK